MNIFAFVSLNYIFQKDGIHKIFHPFLYKSFIFKHVIYWGCTKFHIFSPRFNILSIFEIGTEFLERKRKYLKTNISSPQEGCKFTRKKIRVGSSKKYINGWIFRKYGINRFLPVFNELHFVDIYLRNSVLNVFFKISGEFLFRKES